MIKTLYYGFILCGLLILASCTENYLCKENDVCVKLKKYRYDDKLKICITLKNNTNQDIYLTGFRFLTYGLNVEKEFNGERSDATFEFYNSLLNNEEEDSSSSFWVLEEPDHTEERKRCNVVNYGPISNVAFNDSVVSELFNYVDKSFGELYGADSVKFMSWNLDCIFIPRHSEISDGVSVMIQKIDCDKLIFQFAYPNTNWIDYNLSRSTNEESLRRQIELSKINYPDTLLGYIHYTKPITSGVLEIRK